MSNFSVPAPTPEYLDLLVASAMQPKNITVINKAVRMWYILSHAQEYLSSIDLSSDALINELYLLKNDEDLGLDSQIISQHLNKNQSDTIDNSIYKTKKNGSKKDKSASKSLIFTNADSKPRIGVEFISTKTIPELLFADEGNPQEEWENWKKDLLDYYKQKYSFTKKVDYSILDSEQPFYITKRTVLATLESLLELNSFLAYDRDNGRGKYSLNQEREAPIYISQHQDITTSQKLDLLMEEFDAYFHLFGRRIKKVQRFYIHSDYTEIPTERNVSRLRSIRKVFQDVWSQDRTSIIEFDYFSSSKGEKYTAIVYPVVIYYYQRAFYLCAYGGNKNGSELNWYNYRIDRIDSLHKLDLNNKEIPNAIFDWLDKALAEKDDSCTIDEYLIEEEIESSLKEAYGFDFYLNQKDMLLRFNQDFYNRYIKNTKRHGLIQNNDSKGTVRKFISERAEKSKKNADVVDDSNFITAREKLHLQDVYCKMSYRDGDNSVIMRLRAWGDNVEVISPPELRKRMYQDMKNTWNIYHEDVYPDDK
jgi:CRISPR-associated protein (TIGR03985 family)